MMMIQMEDEHVFNWVAKNTNYTHMSPMRFMILHCLNLIYFCFLSQTIPNNWTSENYPQQGDDKKNALVFGFQERTHISQTPPGSVVVDWAFANFGKTHGSVII